MPDSPLPDSPASDFAALQQWLQNAVLTDDCDGDGDGDGARRRVKESNRLTAAARVGIYARGYALRLIECLRAEYPVLRAWVGDQVFDLFACGYVRACRSRSYTLYDFGAGFADHLAVTRPPAAGAESPEAALAALARVERARAVSVRAAGVERDPPATLPAAAVLPLTPEVRFALPDSVHLLRSDFDVTAMLAAAERGERPAVPPFAPTCLVVARRNYRVHVHKAEPWSAAWLAALGDADGDAYRAATAAAAATGVPAARIIGELSLRAPGYIEAGMIRAIG